MKKSVLYELWSALVAGLHRSDRHPRLARIYVYNNKMTVASRRF